MCNLPARRRDRRRSRSATSRGETAKVHARPADGPETGLIQAGRAEHRRPEQASASGVAGTPGPSVLDPSNLMRGVEGIHEPAPLALGFAGSGNVLKHDRRPERAAVIGGAAAGPRKDVGPELGFHVGEPILRPGESHAGAGSALHPDAGEPDVPAAGRRTGTGRRRLWELWSGYHCSICGTCLSIAELRRIAAKAGLRLPSGAADYEIHGCFVKLAAEPGRESRSMQKLLDRKYRTAIEHCRRIGSETELRAFWTASLDKGDVPGPYWALMTHPLASEALILHAFSEVHMLSHLAGASNRMDIRRLNALESERQTLTEALVAAKRRLSENEAELRRLAERRAAEARTLESQARAARAVEGRLAEAEARIREFEQGEAYRSLQARNAALATALEEAGRTGGAETQRRTELERELSELRTAHDDAASTVRELRAECAALERLLHPDLHGTGGGASAPGASIDLRGRRIAYVGGRTGLVTHFRALVERLNGRFIHHDGGIDDSERRLARILGQADAVLCPVDCVSHGACLLAKQFCKRTAKPFVPLRSAGLSSFVTGLHRAAATGAEGAA